MNKLIFISLLTLSISSYAENRCTATKEYVTASNYLKDKKEFALNPKMIDSIADQISAGCTDAGARFISVVELLVKTGVDSKSAVETGLLFAKLTNAHRDSFISIFKHAYAADYLDLDLFMAHKLAKELASEFPETQEIIKKDFEAIAKFCVKRSGLDLSIKKCAELTKSVVSAAAKNKSELSKSFFDLFDYLQDEKGARLTTGDALTLIEKILPYGVIGVRNFKEGHTFATSKSGLAVDNKQALEFALKMVGRTEGSDLESKSK